MRAVRTLRTPPVLLASITATAVVVLGADPVAYVLSGPRWDRALVSYYVNPANADLPTGAVTPAVAAGADVWPQQSGAAFQFALAGESGQTSNTNDGVNLVLFRNASSGSAIATAYWWSSGARIIDADIVFWDGGFRFFAGTTGCSSGFYIEDIAAHEFGHALGLGHSASPAATMYATTSTCSAANRSLDADDIAGVRELYPPVEPLPAPRPPTGFRFVR